MTTDPPDRPTRTQRRSAITGEFVTAEEAKAHPDTTVTERRAMPRETPPPVHEDDEPGVEEPVAADVAEDVLLPEDEPVLDTQASAEEDQEDKPDPQDPENED